MDYSDPTYSEENLHRQHSALLSHFDGLGLDSSNASYTTIIRKAVNEAVYTLERASRVGTYGGDQSSLAACSEQVLFFTYTTI